MVSRICGFHLNVNVCPFLIFYWPLETTCVCEKWHTICDHKHIKHASQMPHGLTIKGAQVCKPISFWTNMDNHMLFKLSPRTAPSSRPWLQWTMLRTHRTVNSRGTVLFLVCDLQLQCTARENSDFLAWLSHKTMFIFSWEQTILSEYLLSPNYKCLYIFFWFPPWPGQGHKG